MCSRWFTSARSETLWSLLIDRHIHVGITSLCQSPAQHIGSHGTVALATHGRKLQVLTCLPACSSVCMSVCLAGWFSIFRQHATTFAGGFELRELPAAMLADDLEDTPAALKEAAVMATQEPQVGTALAV